MARRNIFRRTIDRIAKEQGLQSNTQLVNPTEAEIDFLNNRELGYCGHSKRLPDGTIICLRADYAVSHLTLVRIREKRPDELAANDRHPEKIVIVSAALVYPPV